MISRLLAMENIVFWIILGIVQGLLEWIPVSSEAFLFIIAILYGVEIRKALIIAILLHFSTCISAIIYYRKDYNDVIKFLVKKSYSDASRRLLSYLLIAGSLTLVIGILIYYAFLSILVTIESLIELSSIVIMIMIGLLLITVGLMMRRARLRMHYKNIEDIDNKDSVIIGIAQAFSVLPGISRSGITISTLLLRNYDQESSVKLSFIITPIVIIPATLYELIMHYNKFLGMIWFNLFVSEVVAFITSILVIEFMTSLARKLDLSKFMIIIGLIIITLNLSYLAIT